MALIKRKVLVIGSGISAYGAILALIKKEKTEIDVIDIGLKGSYKNQPNREIANSKDISGSYFAYGVDFYYLQSLYWVDFYSFPLNQYL